MVEIQMIAGDETPWVIPVTNMTVDTAKDGASTLRFSTAVTEVAFDEEDVDRTNYSTYNLDTDSFGVLRKNRMVRASMGYIVDDVPEYVRRFTGLIQDMEPSHTVDANGATSLTLDVTCIDSRTQAVGPPVTKIEDMYLGSLPNQLSYDIAQYFPEDTTFLGGDGIVRPTAFDKWSLVSVVRTVLYQSGMNATQLWAKDSNGNFLIDDRGVYLEATMGYPYSFGSTFGVETSVKERFVDIESPLGDVQATVPYNHEVESAQVIDLPYLYTFPLDTDPWSELHNLCDSYGLELGVNNDGNVYMRYPDNPTLYSSTDTIGTNILAESDFATHVAWDRSNDFDDTGGNAEYTWSANQTSYVRQSAANRLQAGENGAFYTFTYTVNVTTVPNGDFTLTLEHFCIGSVSLPYTTGTHSVDFYSFGSAQAALFTIQATCTTATQGQFTIDDVSCGLAEETRRVLYGIGWTTPATPRAIGNVIGTASTVGANLLIKFTGVGIRLIFTRQNAESKVVAYIDTTIVNGVNELDSTTGDQGHTDWTDNVDPLNSYVDLDFDSLPAGVSEWYYSDGVHPDLGENPTVFTVADNLTYGYHECIVQLYVGTLDFEGFQEIIVSTEQPQHTFSSGNLMGVSYNESLEALTNDVVIAGNMSGAAGEYVTSRAVDAASINSEASANYIGVRKPWYISDPRITNQERADFLAKHLLFRYRRGERRLALESPGLPWLESGDPVTVTDTQELSDGSMLPVLGLYNPGDLTPAQRSGVGGISPVPFQRYWITETSEQYSIQGDFPQYTMSVTTTAFPPLPAYEPLPEPVQDEAVTPISTIDITIDGGTATYNPFLSHAEGKYVNISFALNWHARMLAVRIIAGLNTDRSALGMDDLQAGQTLNVLTYKTGYIPAGYYEFQWDGWIEEGNGGHYAPDGFYTVEFETERYSTGAGFRCRSETGYPGVESGSEEYIQIALDRNAAYGASPYSATTTPTSTLSSPGVIYDLETNGGLGLKFEVTLACPAQVIIPLHIKFLNYATVPANLAVGSFDFDDWFILFPSKDPPVLEPGTYTFYFNPATDLLRYGVPLKPFVGTVAAWNIEVVPDPYAYYAALVALKAGYSIPKSITTYVVARQEWNVAWHIDIEDGSSNGIIFRDLSGVEESVVPTGNIYYNWNGPRASTYSTKNDRNDQYSYYTFVNTKAAV
jgi:hypothetical protein